MRPFPALLDHLYLISRENDTVLLVPRTTMHTVPMTLLRRHLPKVEYPHYTITFRYRDAPFVISNSPELFVERNQSALDTIVEEILFCRMEQ